MYTNLLVSALGSIALVRAQVQAPPPPPQTLTATESGVLPVLPTPFSGVQTEEGAITYDGPPNPGFVGPGGPAVAQTNNPTTSFTATLPSKQFDPYTGTTIQGSITGVGTSAGVQFTVNFTGFPAAAYGPFVYHIHTKPVPADGNCSATVGHLDPTNRGEYYPCDTANPPTCQAGDLAGKHGNITGTTFTASFVDPYLSTVPGSQYYFGDKSIVIHTTNTTRLTCANFVQSGGGNGTSGGGSGSSGGSGGNGTSTGGGSGSGTSGGPTPTVSTYPGAGSRVSGGLFGAVAAAALAFFL